MKNFFYTIVALLLALALSACSETAPSNISKEELEVTFDLPSGLPDPTTILPPVGCIKNCDNPLFDIKAPTQPWEIKRGVYTNVPVNLAIYDGGNATLARVSARLAGSSNSSSAGNLTLSISSPTFSATVPFKVYTRSSAPKDLWFVEFSATYRNQTQEYRMFVETK
jgi:hypothetical protein